MKLFSSAVLSMFYLATLLMPVAAEGQAATVTFYTNGSHLTSGLPGSKNGIYYGGVFDGNQLLFRFRDGLFVKFHRFITLSVPPGLHTFSASFGKHPAKNSQLRLSLDAGRQYYVRARSESSGILVVEIEKGQLDVVSCAVAHEEASKLQPLTARALAKDTPYARVQTQTIPACQ